MKPEEMDRLFRDELEKLDHVPGVEWSDAAAWTKIKTTLNGGWNFTPWIVSSVVVVIGALALYLSNRIDTKAQQAPVYIAPQKNIRLTDSVLPEKKAVVHTRRRIQKAGTSIPVVALVEDTILLPLVVDTVKTAQKRIHFLSNVPPPKNEFKFSLPNYPVLRLKPDNRLNFTRLLKSIEAQREGGQDLYYHYQYQNNPAPYLYPEYPPGYNLNRNYNITNYNK